MKICQFENIIEKIRLLILFYFLALFHRKSYSEQPRAEKMDSLQKIGITDPWAVQARIGDIPRSFSCITSIQTILKPKSKLSQFAI